MIQYVRIFRIFNKSKYSRNRQIAKNIFFFGIYINTLIINYCLVFYLNFTIKLYSFLYLYLCVVLFLLCKELCSFWCEITKTNAYLFWWGCYFFNLLIRFFEKLNSYLSTCFFVKHSDVTVVVCWCSVCGYFEYVNVCVKSLSFNRLGQ